MVSEKYIPIASIAKDDLNQITNHKILTQLDKTYH